MKDIADRNAMIIAEAKYFIKHKSTVRKTANFFKISKTTVFTDFTQRLPNLNKVLSKQVRKQLDTNKAERHIRGGLSTKKKHSKVSN